MALVAVLVAAGAARTWTRTPVWRSNRTLFLATAASHPEASWTHLMLGRVYVGNGAFARGIAEYRQALSLFDRNPVAWSEAVYAAAQAHELDLADSLVAAAERRIPGDYLVSIAHAYIALNQERFSESLRAAHRALAIAPDSAAALYFAGKAWAALGQPDSARHVLGRIPAEHPLRIAADSMLSALPPPRP
jgi:tetratricopeptide (TPR) repeat protein